MAHRAQFLNSSDIGVFSCLSNSFAIVAAGHSANFYSTFEEELSGDIPVFTTTINATRVVGSMLVGNKNGLLVPNTATDKELLHIRNSLEDSVVVHRVEERLSALGNCISCNDSVALVHKDISRQTVELAEDVLGVEAFKVSISGNPLVGTYCVFTNKGGIVHPRTPKSEQDRLAELTRVPIVAGTINQGSALIGSGLVANDWIAFCGMRTTATEISVVESILGLKDANPSRIVTKMRDSLIDAL